MFYIKLLYLITCKFFAVKPPLLVPMTVVEVSNINCKHKQIKNFLNLNI
jgi:hypothetical protein